MKNYFFIVLMLAAITCCTTGSTSYPGDNNNVQNDPCNDPDAAIKCCFMNMPAEVTNIMKIPYDRNQGEPVIISGTVLKNNKPAGNVFLYAYHTDEKGVYSKSGKETGFQKWHGQLHGWCKSDAEGRYEIRTIRPAPYPGGQSPAHIHMAVWENKMSEPYYISDFVFKDDPFLKYYPEPEMPGGPGTVELKKINGILTGTRNIHMKD